MADGTLIFDTKVDESGFNGSVGNLAQMAKDGLGVLTGNLMTEALTKITDIGRNAIQTGMSFETASSQIAATMGTTVEALTTDMDQYFGSTKINGEEFYGSLIDLAGELGAKTKFTATEAAEGLNILAQSGLNAQDQMSAMPTVLNLAAAGSLDLSNAASYVTGTIKGFGDSMDNAQYYADLMAKGATLANTDVRGLGEALSGAAATAKSYGQEADEVAVALLRLAEQNVTGSVATTALNRAMADLYTPTADAAKALKELSVSAYNLDGSARPVNDVMDDLNKAMSKMTAEERNAYKSTIFTAQGLSAFNKITASGTEKVEEFRDGLAEASEGMGTAAEQAHVMSDNLEGDLTIMGSAMDGFYNAVYSKMQAPLRSLVQWSTSAISELTDGLKEGGIMGMAQAGADIVTNFVDGAIGRIPDILDTGKELVSNIVSGITGGSGELTGASLELIGGFVGNLVNKGLDLIVTGGDFVANLVTGALERLPDLITAAGDLLVGFVDALTGPEGLPALLEGGAGIVRKLANAILTNLPKIVEAAIKVVLKLGETIGKNLPYILAKGKQILTNLINGIKEKFPDLLSSAKEIVTKITDGIKEKLADVLDKGKELAEKAIEGIGSKFSDMQSKAKELINQAIDGISSKLSDVYNKGKEIVDNVKNGITDFMSNLFSVGQSASNQARSGFSSVDFSGIGSSIISSIANAIRNGASSLWNAAKDAAVGAYNAALNALGFGGSGNTVKTVQRRTSSGGGGSASFSIKPTSGQSSNGFSSNATTMTYADFMLKKAVDEIESSIGTETASYAESYTNAQKKEEIDYEKIGEAVADALDGTEVKMDGQTVGNVVTPYVSENLYDEVYSTEKGVI